MLRLTENKIKKVQRIFLEAKLLSKEFPTWNKVLHEKNHKCTVQCILDNMLRKNASGIETLNR